MTVDEIEGHEVPEVVIAPENEPIPALPTPAPGSGNRFQRKEEPKNKQFTGRATEKEYERIQKAIAAQGKGDIVRFVLACLDFIEADFFQTFKTK